MHKIISDLFVKKIKSKMDNAYLYFSQSELDRSRVRSQSSLGNHYRRFRVHNENVKLFSNPSNDRVDGRDPTSSTQENVPSVISDPTSSNSNQTTPSETPKEESKTSTDKGENHSDPPSKDHSTSESTEQKTSDTKSEEIPASSENVTKEKTGEKRTREKDAKEDGVSKKDKKVKFNDEENPSGKKNENSEDRQE